MAKKGINGKHAAAAFSLSTQPEAVRTVEIDGVAYNLRSAGEMRLADWLRAKKRGERLQAIIAGGDVTEETERELDQSLLEFAQLVLPSAPEGILKKLPDGAKLRLIQFFSEAAR